MVARPLETGRNQPRQRVRRAVAADAGRIASLVASAEDLRQVSPLESFPLDQATVLHWILRRNAGYVIEDRGEIVAYGELVPDPDRPDRYWIGHMIVHPRRRGLGLGQRLVHELVRVAEVEKEARVVAISAFADNPRALRCYETCGFERVDQERVEGRALVGMRLHFPARRRSPDLLVLAGAGVLAALTALALWRAWTSPGALIVMGVLLVVGLVLSRMSAERRDPWRVRMRSVAIVVGCGFAAAVLAALTVGGVAGGGLVLLGASGSATLIWIALLGLVLLKQR